MNLSFQQKIVIFEEDQYNLEKYLVKPDKTNFKYKGKVVIREMWEGSTVAYIWGRDIQSFTNKYKVDPRGWIWAPDFFEEELRDLLVQLLSTRNQSQNRGVRK